MKAKRRDNRGGSGGVEGGVEGGVGGGDLDSSGLNQREVRNGGIRGSGISG